MQRAQSEETTSAIGTTELPPDYFQHHPIVVIDNVFACFQVHLASIAMFISLPIDNWVFFVVRRNLIHRKNVRELKRNFRDCEIVIVRIE